MSYKTLATAALLTATLAVHVALSAQAIEQVKSEQTIAQTLPPPPPTNPGSSAAGGRRVS